MDSKEAQAGLNRRQLLKVVGCAGLVAGSGVKAALAALAGWNPDGLRDDKG